MHRVPGSGFLNASSSESAVNIDSTNRSAGPTSTENSRARSTSSREEKHRQCSSHLPMKSLMVLVLATVNVTSAPLVLHVATNGNDNATGIMTRRAGDGPLATMEAALRNARAAGSREGATIFVHGGVHRLSVPLVFTPEDSGLKTKKP